MPGVAHKTELEDVARQIDYETIIIDPNLHRPRPVPVRGSMPSKAFAGMVSYAAQSRGSGKAKYRAPADNRVSVADTAYVIATVADLTFVDMGGIDPVTGVAYAEADDALTYYLSTHPQEAGLYQVASVHEAVH